ncbi:hypothetical protein GCM10007377_15330 [Galliscardovia ingluviei]|uniref:DNA-directed RNA polymerase subunit beta n=1 Tax=Galliscardovia ingluviei TaxID=1769422 RepID=A0A8J3AMA0_9BIFI|nr:hypothetical protein [Galliscardovia ingluviei]GGI15324.1 hypothetical protein GCM10007377_15330 [Galliscardovia ingluviei]
MRGRHPFLQFIGGLIVVIILLIVAAILFGQHEGVHRLLPEIPWVTWEQLMHSKGGA